MRRFKLGTPATMAMALLFAFPFSTVVLAQSLTPFAQLAGSWHGTGHVRWSDGSNGHVTCRSNYIQKPGGSELTLAIRCESETSKIDMKSNISNEGGRLSGTWSEKNFGLEGDIDGSSSANKLSMRITGQLLGSMTVSVNGATHNIDISVNGPGFNSVSIAFSKG